MTAALAKKLAYAVAISAGLVLGAGGSIQAGPRHDPFARPSKLALIKVNDLAATGYRYSSDFRWQACGLATAPPYASKTGRCHPGQVPTYASYRILSRDIADGRLKRGTTILFDQEDWHWTPVWEQAKPERFLRLAGKLARAHGIFIIETAVGKGSLEIRLSKAAAQYASVVAVQTQRLDADPRHFLSFVHRVVTAVRQVSRTVPVMAGLATDAGGFPIRASQIRREYEGAYRYVQYFWLNADQWAPPRGIGCAPTGCGYIGRRFLTSIGL